MSKHVLTNQPHAGSLATENSERRRRSRGAGWWIIGSCGFAGLVAIALWARPYYRKAQLIKEIERVHGSISSAGKRPPEYLWTPLGWIGEPRARWVATLIFDDLQGVRLEDRPGRTRVTNSGWILGELVRYPNLQRLELSLQLTPEDVQAITLLTGLEELDLSECAFQDADVSNLSRLTKLRTLNLSGTQVTDAALADLKKLHSLRQLDMTRTQVSESACRELVDAIPGLDITDD